MRRGDPAGGGCAGRGGGRKTSVPAGASLRSCVRGLAAAGSNVGLGTAWRGPRWGGGASDGASCPAPSPRDGVALGSVALGTGEGVSRAVAERPRTPAGFPGCAEQEPQRSAPAPGSCDLAVLGATPSTPLPISGRGAGLGSRQGAGEKWPKPGEGSPQRLSSGAQGAHPLPPAMLAVATVQWRLFLPAPPRLGAPSAGRGERGVARGRSGSLQGPGSGSQPSSAEPSPAEARNPLAASAQPSAPLLRASANVPPSRLPASPEAAAPPTAARVTPKRSRPLTSNLRSPLWLL